VTGSVGSGGKDREMVFKSTGGGGYEGRRLQEGLVVSEGSLDGVERLT